MTVQLGTFHDIQAAQYQDNFLHLLNTDGIERLLQLRPRFNRKTNTLDPISVSGEFGSFETSQGLEVLSGVQLRGVTAVDLEVTYDDPDEDFHCRSLTVTVHPGTKLQWELYCHHDLSRRNVDGDTGMGGLPRQF